MVKKKEEVIESFEKLKGDISTLQKIVALKENVLSAYENDSEQEKERVMNELDELIDSLQCVELWA